MTVIFAILYIIGKLYYNNNWPSGFTTVTILLLLGIGVNALFLGIIGEYLGRIYQQIKKKPIIIESSLGGLETLKNQ